MANLGEPVYILAIDLGTTNCKAAVLSLNGEIISLSCILTPVMGNDPDKWVDIPEEWWRSVVEVIRKAVSKASISPTNLAVVGVCAFMHTPIGLDRNGKEITPVMIWHDTRSTPQAEDIRREYGSYFREITGDDPRYNHTAAKIRWLVDNYPERVARVRCWLLPKDYLRYKLTGTIASDVSDAIGTMLYDPIKQQWDELLAKAAGTSINYLPQIRETLNLISYVSKSGSDSTGLIEGTPVVGCADGYATLIGADGCSNGRACLYLGTSAWITRYIEDSGADPRLKIVPTEGGYHQWLGASACAGASLSWIAKVLGTEDISLLVESANAVPPGSNGLIFLPHLMKERGPVNNPNAKGAFIGLRLDHNRAEIIRSVLEGVAFQISAVLHSSQSGDQIDTLTAIGGGANSRFWIQIIADILEKNIEVPVIVEAGLLGTAAIAGTAIGLLSNIQIKASGMYHRAYIQKPNLGSRALYSPLFNKFIEMEALFTDEEIRLVDQWKT